MAICMLLPSCYQRIKELQSESEPLKEQVELLQIENSHLQCGLTQLQCENSRLQCENTQLHGEKTNLQQAASHESAGDGKVCVLNVSSRTLSSLS